MGIVFGGMAASLDGYIASESGDLAWLNQSMAADEDYGFEETMKRTGAYIIGAKTYREMVSSGMAGGDAATPTYVVTHEPPTGKIGKGVFYYAGDLRALVQKVKAETDKDICLFGGGDLITQFIELDLLDELGLSIVPVILGGGVPFFNKISEWKRLKLVECKAYKSGIVALYYRLSSSA
jgi:dihydrofolate reductase